MAKKKVRQVDPIIQRLVEMTFAPLETVASWLATLGLEVERRKEGAVTVRNPFLHLTTAILPETDPVTRAVSLGFATAGMYWPHAYPGLLEAVNDEWRLRQKRPTPSPSRQPTNGQKPNQHPTATATLSFENLYRRSMSR